MIGLAISMTMLFVALPLVVWVQWCSFRTHEERIKLITDAFHLPPPIYFHFKNQFEQVTYAKHFRTLLLFGNAMKLYPKIEVTMVATPAGGGWDGSPETMQ